jgi:hypothetical protein
MSRVVIKGLRKQLKLGAPQQPIHEAIQSQEQPSALILTRAIASVTNP